MDQKNILQHVESFIREKFEHEGTGHDWWHIHRVRNLALRIGKAEHADLFIVELGALLHDIADFKFNEGDLKAGPRAARELLTEQGLDEDTIQRICHIVEHVSCKGADVENGMQSLEGKVVQDADRMDALGAIGIARVFAYGGSKNRGLYDPNHKPTLHKTFEEYKNKNSTSINHFYEKLLLLKDKMNTETGKALAQKRHEYLEPMKTCYA